MSSPSPGSFTSLSSQLGRRELYILSLLASKLCCKLWNLGFTLPCSGRGNVYFPVYLFYKKNLAICEDEQQIFIWMVDKLRRITLILNSTQISDKCCAMFGFCYTIMCWIKIQFEWQSYCFVGTVCHSLFAIPNKWRSWAEHLNLDQS